MGERPRSTRSASADSVRVLLVDDEPDIVRAYQAALEDAGYAVTTARDGTAALEAVRNGRPDVVVIDLLMPAMNGWQFMDAFTALPGASCPVIAMTAAGPGALRSAREDGKFSAVLEKPVDLDDLLGMVALLADGVASN
jgi:CheY-like chemotaxis protein